MAGLRRPTPSGSLWSTIRSRPQKTAILLDVSCTLETFTSQKIFQTLRMNIKHFNEILHPSVSPAAGVSGVCGPVFETTEGGLSCRIKSQFASNAIKSSSKVAHRQ